MSHLDSTEIFCSYVLKALTIHRHTADKLKSEKNVILKNIFRSCGAGGPWAAVTPQPMVNIIWLCFCEKNASWKIHCIIVKWKQSSKHFSLTLLFLLISWNFWHGTTYDGQISKECARVVDCADIFLGNWNAREGFVLPKVLKICSTSDLTRGSVKRAFSPVQELILWYFGIPQEGAFHCL